MSARSNVVPLFPLFDQQQVHVACADNLSYMRPLRSESMQLIVSSPPYNIGKSYEMRHDLDEYVSQQSQVISECVRLLDPMAHSAGRLEIMLTTARYFH